MSVVLFKIGGIPAENVDATSDVTTDAFKFDISHDWSVSFKDNSVVGLPTYTIEVSNNQSTWYNLHSLSNNVKFVDSITSDFLSYSFMRILYSANGATGGTVNIELSTKNKTKARG